MNETKLDKKDLFENTPVPKAILSLSIPTIISQLIHLIYNIADTFFVGRTGNPYMIAGVSLSFTLFMLSLPVANLFGIGGGSQIARMMGRGDGDEAKTVSAYSFWTAAAVLAVMSLLVLIFMNPLLKLLGASEQTMPYCRQYVLTVVVLGYLPTALSSILAHFLRNTGYAKQASMGLSGGGILNIILDPLLMFVVFPAGMEVFAAALATLISNIIATVYLAFMVRKVSSEGVLNLGPSHIKGIQPENRKSIFSVGIPSALMPGFMDIANIILNGTMAGHGDLQLAAIGIVMKIERLSGAIGLGLGQGMMPLVAYNYASGDHTRMKKVINTGRMMGLAAMLLCVVIYQCLAKPLCGVFLNTSSGEAVAVLTIGYAVTFLRIRSLAAPFQVMNYMPSFCMQAMNDGKSTMIHAIIRTLLAYIPFMFIFNAIWGATGLVTAFPAGEAVGAVAAAILLHRCMKRTIGKE